MNKLLHALIANRVDLMLEDAENPGLTLGERLAAFDTLVERGQLLSNHQRRRYQNVRESLLIALVVSGPARLGNLTYRAEGGQIVRSQYPRTGAGQGETEGGVA